jgi:hypothetical protein
MNRRKAAHLRRPGRSCNASALAWRPTLKALRAARRRADQEAVDGPEGGRPAADLEERAVARTKERADVERESDESRRVDEVV